MIRVVGEALIDLVIAPSGDVAAALGGAPFNTARAAARLGAPVEFAGTLSEDRFGSMLAAQLTADGVAIVAPRTALPTTLAAAELDDSGAASYRFYIAGTSVPALDAAPPASSDGSAGSDGSTDVFFTGGLALVLQPMADTVLDMIAGLDDSTLVMFDVNCRPRIIDDRAAYLQRIDQVFARADVVKVSDDDLGYLAPGEAPLVAARHLLAAGPQVVLVTAGAATTAIVTADGVRQVPVSAPPGPVVDTIGAGDTFGGGFIAWWVASGRTRSDLTPDAVEAAVRAAHAAAGIVVTRRGADPPHRADLPADWA